MGRDCNAFGASCRRHKGTEIWGRTDSSVNGRIEVPTATPGQNSGSTGLLTAVHEVTVGSVARVDYGPFGWFEVAFEAIPSRKRRR